MRKWSVHCWHGTNTLPCPVRCESGRFLRFLVPDSLPRSARSWNSAFGSSGSEQSVKETWENLGIVQNVPSQELELYKKKIPRFKVQWNIPICSNRQKTIKHVAGFRLSAIHHLGSWSPSSHQAALSPIITHGALVLPLTILRAIRQVHGTWLWSVFVPACPEI